MLFFSDSFSAFLLSCFPRCAIIQVPQGLLPASTSKKSAIPQLLCPGGLVLIITVQLQHIPSRPGHHFPSGGRLSPQVSFLQPAVASSNYTGGGVSFFILPRQWPYCRCNFYPCTKMVQNSTMTPDLHLFRLQGNLKHVCHSCNRIQSGKCELVLALSQCLVASANRLLGIRAWMV